MRRWEENEHFRRSGIKKGKGEERVDRVGPEKRGHVITDRNGGHRMKVGLF